MQSALLKSGVRRASGEDDAFPGLAAPHRFAGSAPRALAWGLLFFIGAQLAMLVWMEHRQPALRDPEYAQRLKILRQRLAEEPDRPLLLVLGSSRTSIGFRPCVLADLGSANAPQPLVFNYGLVGTDPVLEYLMLRRMLDEGIRPRWLAVEVLPPVLHQEGLGKTELYHVNRLGCNDLLRASGYVTRPGPMCLHWARERCVPWLSQRFQFMDLYAPEWIPWDPRQEVWRYLDPQGWLACVPETMSEDECRKLLEATHREYEGMLENFHISEQPDRALRDLLTLCRDEQIAVVLYLMPEASAFRSWYPPAARTAIAGYLDGLSREYGVPVADARDWIEDAGFIDGHHMLPGAAATFSRRFGRDVLRPLVISRPLVGSP